MTPLFFNTKSENLFEKKIVNNGAQNISSAIQKRNYRFFVENCECHFFGIFDIFLLEVIASLVGKVDAYQIDQSRSQFHKKITD
jgi:hypothetical protein